MFNTAQRSAHLCGENKRATAFIELSAYVRTYVCTYVAKINCPIILLIFVIKFSTNCTLFTLKTSAHKFEIRFTFHFLSVFTYLHTHTYECIYATLIHENAMSIVYKHKHAHMNDKLQWIKIKTISTTTKNSNFIIAYEFFPNN